VPSIRVAPVKTRIIVRSFLVDFVAWGNPRPSIGPGRTGG
jgi:hypothetical protein